MRWLSLLSLDSLCVQLGKSSIADVCVRKAVHHFRNPVSLPFDLPVVVTHFEALEKVDATGYLLLDLNPLCFESALCAKVSGEVPLTREPLELIDGLALFLELLNGWRCAPVDAEVVGDVDLLVPLLLVSVVFNGDKNASWPRLARYEKRLRELGPNLQVFDLRR